MRGLIELEEHFPKGDRIECNHLIHFTVTYNLTNEKKTETEKMLHAGNLWKREKKFRLSEG